MSTAATGINSFFFDTSTIVEVSQIEELLTPSVKSATIDAVLAFQDLDEDPGKKQKVYETFEDEEYLQSLFEMVESESGVRDLVILASIALAQIWD